MAIGDYYWSGQVKIRSPGPALNSRRPLVTGFIAGLLAALVLSTVMSLARLFELSQLNLELNIGVLLMHGQLEPDTWWVGYFGYLAAGGLLGVAYGFLFVAGMRASFFWGLVLGILQWGLAGAALGLLPKLPSEIPAKVFQPGFFALNLGIFSAVLFGLVQVSYAVMVANMFQSSAAARGGASEVRSITPAEKEQRRSTKQAA